MPVPVPSSAATTLLRPGVPPVVPDLGATAPDAEGAWVGDLPLDVVGSLAPLRRGPGDPSHRVLPGPAVWRTTRTPDGPATVRLAQHGPVGVHALAWGPGAAAAVAQVPELLGHDDPDGFVPGHPVVERAWQRHRGLRVVRTGRVLDALVPAVVEQRVHLRQAWASWQRLLVRHGDPAPGPVPGLRVAPDAEGWARVPRWDWHAAGVDPGRARTVVACARLAGRLEECVLLPAAEALDRLRTVPGVGPWTAAEVAQRALGDADAVSVGDVHLPGLVGWALAGRRADDAGMLALLAPWRPHRHRVVRLLISTPEAWPPRRAPRLSLQDHRGH